LDYDITPEARGGLKNILDHLTSEFGLRFSESYYLDFEDVLFLATTQPHGFPMASQKRNLRKLVFRKRTSIYYQVTDHIKVIAIIDNRQDFKI
jgi:plasmid stabilization system protein ParE